MSYSGTTFTQVTFPRRLHVVEFFFQSIEYVSLVKNLNTSSTTQRPAEIIPDVSPYRAVYSVRGAYFVVNYVAFAKTKMLVFQRPTVDS